MRVVLLTGSHPRHAFVARAVAAAGELAALVIEEREPHEPEPPPGLDPHLVELFREHFARRRRAEERFFGSAQWPVPELPVLRVRREDLNGPEVRDLIRRAAPGLLLSYGVHRLRRATLEACPGPCWNLHGGLSPWYRGAITHFWPSYLLEPRFTGMTVHELTPRLDGGPIVHQAVAPLVRGDGLHDLSCRAVVALAEELPRLLALLRDGRLRPPVPQKTAGKLWLVSDWRPEHLRVIYDLYEDRVVDACLDGRIADRRPELVRQF